MKNLMVVVMGLILTGGPTWQLAARAAEPGEEPAKPTDPNARPWADGVSQEDQDAAIELFGEGTRLLKEAFFTKAVDLYRQALARWDHPAIHFNLAKALMNLDQPVEAYNHLEMSMKYGGAPLDEDQIEQVTRYRGLLYETELAEITVTATEPGAAVSLNGTLIFRAPGTWKGVVRPDNVTVLASKEGYQTTQVKPKLVAGTRQDISLTLLPIEDSVKYERAFSNAIPWTVIGTGALLLAGGGIANWQASSKYSEYDDAIDKCNADTAVPIIDDNGKDTGGRLSGCMPTSEINDMKSSGELMETLSLVGYFAGGAVLATGFVLLWVNREKPVAVEGTIEQVTILPYIGPDGAGVSANIGF